VQRENVRHGRNALEQGQAQSRPGADVNASADHPIPDFRAERFSTLAGSAMTVTRGSDAHHSGSASFDGLQDDERLHVRFRAWRRAFVLCGVLTGILIAALFGLFILRGTASPAPSPVTNAAAPATSPASGTATSSVAVATSSSQTAQTLAVAGLIIGCVSAIGTLFSGWGTLVTARAMARQDLASRAPRARAKSTRPRTRKRK
jgi:hypothetical protein